MNKVFTIISQIQRTVMGLFWIGKVPLERAGRESGMQLVVILGRVKLDKLSGLGTSLPEERTGIEWFHTHGAVVKLLALAKKKTRTLGKKDSNASFSMRII